MCPRRGRVVTLVKSSRTVQDDDGQVGAEFEAQLFVHTDGGDVVSCRVKHGVLAAICTHGTSRWSFHGACTSSGDRTSRARAESPTSSAKSCHACASGSSGKAAKGDTSGSNVAALPSCRPR